MEIWQVSHSLKCVRLHQWFQWILKQPSLPSQFNYTRNEV